MANLNNLAPNSAQAGNLDCQAGRPSNPVMPGNPPPIDYLSKDFLSFRQALLNFSTLRYPNWQERSEADFGVMFLEALCAIADELSYTQDRIANEAGLQTATQRRSVLRFARMLDYEPMPVQAAITDLQFEVNPGVSSIPHGLRVDAPGPDGSVISFETGFGLRDTSPPPPANALWNRAANIRAYGLDEGVRILPSGATQMYVLGQGYGFQAGQSVLIETQLAENAAIPPVRQIVQLQSATEVLQPLPVQFGSPPCGQQTVAVTSLQWQAADALSVARDLCCTTVIGNLAQATQGRTICEAFVIGPSPAANMPAAIERTGPRPLLAAGLCGETPVIRLYTLANAPLTWFSQPQIDASGWPVPEIQLTQTAKAGDAVQTVNWVWRRRLLSAQPTDSAFTIDPAAYRLIAQNSDGSQQYDYDSDAGDTIRFGDDVFGAIPESGAQFTVTYRYGAGAGGNVAAGNITQIDRSNTAGLGILTAMNPFPAGGGADAQTLQSIQRLAPYEFQATQLRAVTADDYTRTAETLPWVRRAGTQVRWTGSWLSTFTTVEPLAGAQIPISDHISLINLLNRYRMAGTETYTPGPDYVSLDIAISLAVQPGAFAVWVQQTVMAALAPGAANSATAFFAYQNFAFGQALERSALQAAIQAIPGVAGIAGIRYRLSGGSVFTEMNDSVLVGHKQIIRCDNNPGQPQNGSLAVIVRGGS